MTGREADGGEEAWNPTFPWERAGRWFRATETGRFVVYNVAVFGLVGAAFVLQALPSLARSSPRGIQIGIRTGPPSAAAAFTLALGSALAMAPLLAVVSGVLAGLFLRPSTGAKATTATVGVAAGAGTLLALFVGASLLLGGRGVSGVEGLAPVLSAVGAAAVAAGTAALTDLFMPTRPTG